MEGASGGEKRKKERVALDSFEITLALMSFRGMTCFTLERLTDAHAGENKGFKMVPAPPFSPPTTPSASCQWNSLCPLHEKKICWLTQVG